MAKKRPWLKIMNKNGVCVRRCKDVRLASVPLVHPVWKDNDYSDAPYPTEHLGFRLEIGGVEYNAPTRQVIIGTGNGHEQKAEVIKQLEYLIQMHEAFYD